MTFMDRFSGKLATINAEYRSRKDDREIQSAIENLVRETVSNTCSILDVNADEREKIITELLDKSTNRGVKMSNQMGVIRLSYLTERDMHNKNIEIVTNEVNADILEKRRFLRYRIYTTAGVMIVLVITALIAQKILHINMPFASAQINTVGKVASEMQPEYVLIRRDTFKELINDGKN